MGLFKFRKKVKRDIFLDGEIDDDLATMVVSEILKLDDGGRKEDIRKIIDIKRNRFY